MQTIAEYSIVRGADATSLIKSVRLAIEDGFQPIGGVSIGVGPMGDALFLQAVVKYDEPKKANWAYWDDGPGR